MKQHEEQHNQQQPTATTLRQALTLATTQLAQNPDLRDHARRDAELLLLHHLGITRAQLLADHTREITPTQLAAYEASITRRLTSEPIQYITGHQEFYGLNFHITPAVLIPRPETELLVEAVLKHLPANQPLRIADIGTGSGILAITLAVHLPQAEITAIDISPEALAIARHNAETHHVAHRIHFVESDLLTTIPNQQFDAIVSNPPYVPTTDRETLHPQVRDHEPATALFAGPTGLDIYTRLIPQAYAALTPGGLLALEIGYGQSEAIQQLLTAWQDVTILNDLQQIPRTAIAFKPSSTETRHNISMKAAELQTHLYDLEEQLLHPDRQKDRSTLYSLLAEDFKEFCSSGRIFSRTQTIEAMQNSAPRAATISHFNITPLAEGVVLATYHATTLTSISHRSSIWVLRDKRWQLLFHQGTVAL
jgi:release factor glutamine methyltransferase